jgi:hypothetical protein
MKNSLRLLMIIALSALCRVAGAQDIEVKNAWIRGTVPAQKSTGAFMDISARRNARLVSVQSNIADMVEIHRTSMQNGMMHMQGMDAGIELPAGKTVKLAPGGYHVMFMGLKQQMKAGTRVPLKLNFEFADGKRESLEVTTEVRDITGTSAGAGGHAH